MKKLNDDEVRQSVRETYGKIARSEASGCGCSSSGCCGPGVTVEEVSETMGYSAADLSGIPEGANMGLGCGNPAGIASLKSGETVLDLGCGGGFDCFLASRAVGDNGKVIGIDMTAEMISKARRNAEKAGTGNVEFRFGEIEHLPVADAAVDVIISNCVINLSPDKPQVFRDAFRVLKPGGRLAVSDIVATAELPQAVKNDMEFYAGCIAGALLAREVERLLAAAGFKDIVIESVDGSRELIQWHAPGVGIENYIMSANIRAVKPA